MRYKKLVLLLTILMGSLVFTGDLLAKVVRAYATVKPTSFNGQCPKKFTFLGRITSNSRGVVKYKWLRSDNANAPVKTIRFNKPGTKTVTTTWTLGAPGMTYNGWQAVRILAPNQMTSNRAAFKLKCGVSCGIQFKSLSKTSGYPGDTFKMYGTWGASQGTKTPCINKGGPNKLIVLSWSNSVLNVRIPTGLAPGKYRVGVYCKFPIIGKTGGSTWKDFTVKSRIVRPLRPVQTIKPLRVKPGLITRNCPDPAAVELRFQILSRDPANRFKGRVRITGIVKNIGSKRFIAGPNQAKAYLYEVPIGSTSGRVRAQRAITSLAPGATMSLSFERNWYSASPSEGEFPPSYRLQILLDPDIYMDASKDNDDCSQTNNKKERSGSDINRMFR
ncbi:MAG: hypothetical protein GY950_01250 [bacterium]|nr:hypothetical protein [bacterium]